MRYDYSCKNCKKIFELDLRLRIKEKYDRKKEGLRCPDCGGRLAIEISAPALSSERVTAGC